jgi:hypothetical protein
MNTAAGSNPDGPTALYRDFTEALTEALAKTGSGLWLVHLTFHVADDPKHSGTSMWPKAFGTALEE